MKLTGELKEKVKQAETKEEAKKILSEAGVHLNDEEISAVSGGCGTEQTFAMIQQCKCSGESCDMIEIERDSTGRIVTYLCPHCGRTKTVYE